jgi:hypothetical protein
VYVRDFPISPYALRCRTVGLRKRELLCHHSMPFCSCKARNVVCPVRAPSPKRAASGGYLAQDRRVGWASIRSFDNVKLLKRLVNMGHAKSLVAHPASTTHRQLDDPAETDSAFRPRSSGCRSVSSTSTSSTRHSTPEAVVGRRQMRLPARSGGPLLAKQIWRERPPFSTGGPTGGSVSAVPAQHAARRVPQDLEVPPQRP